MLAKNRGGAWGLLQDTPEYVRRPFFLLVSALAITFIVSLYRRLAPNQSALRWGLPLVLGGALGTCRSHPLLASSTSSAHDLGRPRSQLATFNVADMRDLHRRRPHGHRHVRWGPKTGRHAS